MNPLDQVRAICDSLPNSELLEFWAGIFEKPRRSAPREALSQDQGSAYAARCIRAVVAIRRTVSP